MCELSRFRLDPTDYHAGEHVVAFVRHSLGVQARSGSQIARQAGELTTHCYHVFVIIAHLKRAKQFSRSRLKIDV